MTFEELRLTKPLLRAVRLVRYKKPTPIQAQCIPIVLSGRDVLGCAQTGTGKTAAFVLPIAQRLANQSAQKGKRSGGARVLVLCPTRELAQQIHDSFSTYGQFTGVRQTVVFGGVNQNPQAKALRAGVDVLIATPGRLLDLMEQDVARVDGTEILVLDEADRMLDMGFARDLRRILAHVPRKRQTLLFSATMPPAIRKLADEILHKAANVQVAPVSSAAATVTHRVYHVEKAGKTALLLQLLGSSQHTRSLVFTRTKHGADKLVRQLAKSGVAAAALHGNKSQGARTRALAEFRSAQTPVLIATDLAARGLDVDDISRVINYDLTHEPETYIHRIGRTGRAGSTGIAFSFCTADDLGDLQAIEKLLGEPMHHATEQAEFQVSPSVRNRIPHVKQAKPRSTGRKRSERKRARSRSSSLSLSKTADAPTRA